MVQNQSYSKLINVVISFIFLLVFSVSFAQEKEQKDTIGIKNKLSQIKLKHPQSVVLKYTYNPVIEKYVYTEKVGDTNLKTPMFLSSEEYESLVMREQMRDYFSKKFDAVSQNKNDSDELKSIRRNLLPELYVNSEFFETIFGGNTIEVVPQGSFAIDLGLRYLRSNNPFVNAQDRNNYAFDFNQYVNLGFTGKVGTRIKVAAQYNTQATFDFQNIFKLDFEPDEDQILQKVELGNVSMPFSNSLINGAQSLFGVKTELKFGRTTITGVVSEQRSQTKNMIAQGGGTLTNFDIMALDYDENRNYFLSHFFRNQYNEALENYPFIKSKVQITRIEVWVTNRNNMTGSVRNIVALQDLGEAIPENTLIAQRGIVPSGFFKSGKEMPTNEANAYNPNLIGKANGKLTKAIRDVATVKSGFGSLSDRVREGTDYSVIENARRLLEGRDFKINTKLGYISLSQRLNNDEILAVAYQYTYNGKVYQVGEFANDGISAISVNQIGGSRQNAITNNCLVLKLLKSNRLNTTEPIWKLMMKNIYSLNTFRLDREDFRLNVFYINPSPVNYLSPVDVNTWPTGLDNKVLLQLFNLDRLNKYNDPQDGGDGFFDFLPGITIDPEYGRIIFTQVEPFGKYLYEKLGGGNQYNHPENYNANQKKYVFRSMYAQTKSQALEDAGKNKFQIKGRYKSTSGRGISLGAFNVPKGSVYVRAGGRRLQEGIDYTVNYQSGIVYILDPSLEASNIPIEVSVENNLIFGRQNRLFMGVNIEHQFNNNFVIGASLLNLRERPFTQKSNFGQESVNNTIFGFGGNYSTEIPFLTRWVNRLPTMSSDVKSNLSVRGEFAYLLPSSPKADNFDGETTAYLEDFEASQTTIDIHSPLAWNISSTPLAFGKIKNKKLFGSSPDDPENLKNGYKRAKLSWYSIDPIFYSNQRPSEISTSEISKNSTRRILINEIFPEIEVVEGQTLVQHTLDLAYYPEAKGPYNNNPNFQSESSSEKWAGIMRGITTTNFVESNIEYIQFWLLDPYYDSEFEAPGELVFNLGYISEDILKDGRKQYENGLPARGLTSGVNTTSWGSVPSAQSLLYAFDTNTDNRQQQDVGLDGENNLKERNIYTNNLSESPNDPALDDYRYYLDATGGILNRYYNYNGLENNSPVAGANSSRGSSTIPDVEDLNKDNTMNTIDSYFEYHIPINSNITRSDNYVSDIRIVETETPNGGKSHSRWIQFKVPIKGGNPVGGIKDFNSIPFMRVYLTKFAEPIVLRFGTLELIRGDWRNYQKSLSTDKDDPSDDQTLVDVNTVNILENESRQPIPYVLPPGVERERLRTRNTLVKQNEQSLSFAVCNLQPKDARAVFKNINADLRQYKYIKMFLHAEAYKQNPLSDDELVAFIRIGSDFEENYYQVEIPLRVTSPGSTSPAVIWPSENNLTIPMDILTKLKAKGLATNSLDQLTYYDENLSEISADAQYSSGKNRYGIKGNPSLGNVRALMIGVRNATNNTICGEVWFNELRLSELENKGGWAAIAALDANAADLANISATGRMSTVGFGAIEQTPNERSREDFHQYDVMMNVNAGKLLPQKWGLQIPVNLNISKHLATPEYDPVYQDLKLKDRLETATTEAQRQRIQEQAEDFTLRRGINLIGVRKNLGAEQKNHFYNIENFTFNYGYNEMQHHDFEVEREKEQFLRTGALYAYSFEPFKLEPLKKVKFLSGKKYWQWLSDINLNLLPSSVTLSSNITRNFNIQKFRDISLEGVDATLQKGLPELQQRNYRFDWQYGVNYNLTPSLRLDFNATNNHIVRNYYAYDVNGQLYANKDLSIWDRFWDFGDPNHFYSDLQVNYELPFDKIPFLKFIKASYSYSGNFDWQRGSQVLIDIAGEQINSIQNANSHTLTANMNFDQLYRWISGGNRKQRDKNNSNFFSDFAKMIKRVGVNYSETNGTILPGFTPVVGLMGTTKPSLGFVLGGQNDIRYQAARNGYLSTFEDLNEPFYQSHQSKLNITANIQPLRDLQVDFIAEKQYVDSYSETFDVRRSVSGFYEYHKLIGNQIGNFSISSNMIATTFSNSDAFTSVPFDQFKKNQIIVARRLANHRGIDLNNPINIDEDGFPKGYGKTNQAVLIPAFLSAYTGKSAEKVSLGAFRNIPIPGWNIRYTGLMKFDYFRKKFRRFSITHGYNSSYSLTDFRANLEYDSESPNELDKGDNFLNERLFSNVNLIEQFSPLLKLDFEMRNSVSTLAELRRNRIVSISLDNDYLTEILQKEYRFGLGYRFKDLRFSLKWDGKETTLKSDLILKADITYRNNLTVIRNMKTDDNQVTAGQNSWAVHISADYALTANMLAAFYFDYNFSKTAISTAFPMTTIRSGISIRYNFN